MRRIFYFHLTVDGEVGLFNCGFFSTCNSDLPNGSGLVGRWYSMDADEDFIEFWSRLEKIRE